MRMNMAAEKKNYTHTIFKILQTIKGNLRSEKLLEKMSIQIDIFLI